MQHQYTPFPSLAVTSRNRPMVNEIVPAHDDDGRAALAQIADAYARQDVFDDYLSRKAENTRNAQRADLDKFSEFLAIAAWPNPPSGEELQTSPAAWQRVTHGIVTAFRNWQLQQGYATATVNRRLSTVRKYCKLAFAAGVIDETTNALIVTVQGYSGKDAQRIDERREDAGTPTRTGDKKAEHVSITDDQADALKRQPDTPQGRRDALLMCILLDLGLRVGEVARLRVRDLDLHAGTLFVHRPKVGKTQTHKLPADTLRAAHAWVDSGDCPVFEDAPLLRSSRRGGALGDAGMTERSISKRVRDLGVEVGHYRDHLHVTAGGKRKYRKVGTLSAHDCRHYWTTFWAKRQKDLPRGIFTLQEAGGWSSLAMPRRYTEQAQIANEGMA